MALAGLVAVGSKFVLRVPRAPWAIHRRPPLLDEHHDEILGQRCYPSLSEIPADVRIDIVDVFRRPEHVAAIAPMAGQPRAAPR